MVVIRRSNRSTQGNFSAGKKAISICQRSGLKKAYTQMTFEPGTNYWVHESESDGQFSLVSHPQNYPPKPKAESQAIRNASIDVPLSIGTVVSADQLAIVLGLPPNANFSGYYPTSIASATTD